MDDAQLFPHPGKCFQTLIQVGPGMRSQELTLGSFTVIPDRGAPVSAEVANPNQRIQFNVPFTVEAGDLLRREKSATS